MERELKIKIMKLIFVILGFMLSLILLLGGIVYFLVHLWLSAILMLFISILLFLLTIYFYLGTSVYVIFENSMYVPRLYRYGKARDEKILEFSNVKKIREYKGILRDGFLLYVSDNGYYFIKKSVFSEIRDKIPLEINGEN